jgi:hypothetical protein
MVRFGLKKRDKIDSLKKCLNRLKWRFHEYTDEYGQTKITIYGKELQLYLYTNYGGYSNEKRIPRNVLNLSRENLTILFNSLMWDGTVDDRENRTAMSYSSTSKELAENFQEIALKLGYSTVFNIKKGSGFNHSLIYYQVNISRGRDKHIQNVIREKYIGTVFCFSTPTGFYVTERNGCIAIQGNTAQETQADGVKRAAVKEAEGRRQAAILEAEGLAKSKVIVANGEAERIKLVNQAAQRYFVGNAQKLRQLDVTQASLESNSKIILTEKGINPQLLIGELPVKEKKS